MKIPATCIFRTLIGIVFILSGVSKAIDSDGFIHTLIGYGFDMLSYIGAIISPLEIILGLCLLLNIWTRNVAFIVFALTFLFTAAFGYAYFFRGVEDCGCFGDWFRLSPAATFIRNALIIIGALFVWHKTVETNNPSKKWKVVLLTIIGAFSFAMGGFTVDNSLATTINIKSLKGKRISQTKLKSLNLDTGKYAIFVFSPSCHHCWNSTENIKQLKSSGLLDNVIGVVADTRLKDLDFYKEKMKPNFEIKSLKREYLDKTMGMRVPKLLIINSGVITQIYENEEIPCPQLLKIQ